MAVGSFALGEVQTEASPQVGTQSVATTNDDSTGEFTVTDGEYGQTNDYHFDAGTGNGGVLYIHPQSSNTTITIKNANPDLETSTIDSIEISPVAGGNIANDVNIILAGVNIDRSHVLIGEPKPALKIAQNADFNVNILLPDGIKNTFKGELFGTVGKVQGTEDVEESNALTKNQSLFSSQGASAGIEKCGNDGTGKLTIGIPDGSEVNVGTVYGNAFLNCDFTISKNATLNIPQKNSLTINSDKTLTVPDGAVLTNDGTLTIKGTLSCTDTGKVETLLNYDKQLGMTKANDDNHVIYQDATEVKKYENMPSVEKEGYDFDGWYTKEKGQGTKVEEGDDILLNEHTLYANWIAEPEPTPTPPTPTPPGPEPEPTPTPEPIPDPSVNPDGDGSGSSSKTSDPFMGGMALALLGVATTGAVLVRKRK